MKNNDTKHFAIRMPPTLYYKLKCVAKHEKRSGNGQILYLIRKCISEFEKRDGVIEVPEEVTGEKKDSGK